MDNNENNTSIVQSVQDALSQATFQDLDAVGNVFPQANNGHRAIIYGLIAFGSHLSTPAWISMGLFWWPATGIIFSGGMFLHFLTKSLNSPRPGSNQTDSTPDSASTQSQRRIGPVTRLGAVDVAATPVAEPRQPAEAEPIPQYVDNPFTRTNQERSASRYQGDVYASPEDKAESVVSLPNRGELMAMPTARRAEFLLDLMAEQGCDLWGLVNDPIVAVTGEQQSGKSTLLIIICILEAALHGKQVHYRTTDGDIYPVKYQTMGNTEQEYRDAIATVKGLTKGRAGDQIWLFDEVTKQDRATIAEPLWMQLLTGFVKTRAKGRLVVHGKTIKAMGIPDGFNEQAKNEATLVRAYRALDLAEAHERRKLPVGGRYPSGEYRILSFDGDRLVETNEVIKLPDWLQFEVNEEGFSCYVRSLLALFPELKGAPIFARETLQLDSIDTFEFSGKESVATGNPSPSSEVLPGTKRTLSDLAKVIGEYIKKHPGREFLFTTTSQGLSGREKAEVKPYLDVACRYLAATQSNHFTLGKDIDGKDRITYQEKPLTFRDET